MTKTAETPQGQAKAGNLQEPVLLLSPFLSPALPSPLSPGACAYRSGAHSPALLGQLLEIPEDDLTQMFASSTDMCHICTSVTYVLILNKSSAKMSFLTKSDC